MFGYELMKNVIDDYVRKLTSAPTESTPILNTRNNINSRRVTEKKIAVTGMFIYILLAGITLFSLFYTNKKMDYNNPDNLTGDYGRRRPPTQILLFSIIIRYTSFFHFNTSRLVPYLF